MPAVEAWQTGAANVAGNSFEDADVAGPENLALDNDFDRVMQASLAPRPPKAAGHDLLPAEKNPPPRKAPPAATPATSTSEKKTGSQVSREKTDSPKSNPAGTNGKNASDLNPAPMAADAAESLPVFLSLPLFLSGSFSDPKAAPSSAEKLVPAEKTSASASPVLLPATDKNPPTVLPAMIRNLAAAYPTGKLVVPMADVQKGSSEANLPVKDFAPLPMPTATALEKNAPKVETLTNLAMDAQPKSTGTAAVKEPAAELPPPDISQPAANAANKLLDLDPTLSINKAAENAGTGVATMVPEMKNPLKTTKVAGLDLKVLPVGENGDASEKTLPSPLLITPVRPLESHSPDLNFSFANGNDRAPATESTPVFNILDLPPLADARMRALERTHDMMALHSMRLVESKLDVLSVVIKPAVGTELSLELRQHAGGVEAHATLTRGDHQFLNQHWPELQQRLEQRGIKLAPLGGEANFSSDSNGHFQPPQTSQEDAAQQASAFAEFASVGDAGGATARLALVHDGWESWA